MKLPFPHRFAAALHLHVTRQKVTLFILLPWMFAAAVAGVIGSDLEDRLPKLYRWPLCIAVAVAIAVILEFLIGFLPPLLWKAVQWGVIGKPNLGRLSHFVCWLGGWEENWKCPACGYDLRAKFSGYDYSTPPPDRCPECGAVFDDVKGAAT